MAQEQDAPWSVEVPASEIPRLEGPEGATLKRLCRATGCDIEVSRQRKRKGRSVSFQGQQQTVEDEDEGKEPVKVFIRGVAKRRAIAAEVIEGVAKGEDPEDHMARAEGCTVLPQDLRHPEREAWARWRLLAAAHEFGAEAHLGRNNLRLTPKAGGALPKEVAQQLETAAKDVISEAFKLAELKVDALDELEPETAPEDPAVLALVEQHGVILRVCDQDDNAISEYITVRVIGPAFAAQDAVMLLTARYVDGYVTAGVLQVLNQVQDMSAEMTKDFEGDLKMLQEECKVKVEKGRSVLCLSGEDEAKVAEATTMLQEMLQYYLPQDFLLQQNVAPAVLERLREDEDLGVLMARPDCVVQLDEPGRSVWICGRQRAAVQQRIAELAKLPAPVAGGEGEARPGSRRRTNKLSFHSECIR